MRYVAQEEKGGGGLRWRRQRRAGGLQRLAIVRAFLLHQIEAGCIKMSIDGRENVNPVADPFPDGVELRGIAPKDARRLHTAGDRLDECADLLAAVADGLVVRALADPQAHVVDHSQRRSLLGTAALALIAGCVVREGQIDAVPLEQVVRDMAGKAPAAPRARTA